MEAPGAVPVKGMICRRAGPEDYEAVMAIREVYDGYDQLTSMYHTYLKDPTRHLYVATIDGEVVSYGYPSY